MSDIVERLRRISTGDRAIRGFINRNNPVFSEAAAEIERLRQRVEALKMVIGRMECGCLPYAKPHDGMCPRCMALLEASDG